MNNFGFSWERQINTFHSCAGWRIPSSFTEFLQNKDAEQFREEAAGALTVTLHTHSKRWLQSQGAAGDGTSGEEL